MELDIFIVGIVIIVIFITPFYFVVRASRNADKKGKQDDETSAVHASDRKKHSNI